MFKVIYFMIFWNGDNPVNEGFSLFFKKNGHISRSLESGRSANNGSSERRGTDKAFLQDKNRDSVKHDRLFILAPLKEGNYNRFTLPILSANIIYVYI